MYICNYCKRVLKDEYEKCLGCGGSSFQTKSYLGEVIINYPPKDGYKVNIENYKIQKKPGKIILLIGIFILFYILGFSSTFIFFSSDEELDIFNIVFVLFGLIFLIVGFKTFYDFYKESKKITNPVNRNIKKTKELSKNGILIKNLNYKIKPVDKRIKGPLTVYKIQVLYEVEKGKTKCFESEPKYLTALGRDDGTVDLLLDPNDYNNYFIDFEIY